MEWLLHVYIRRRPYAWLAAASILLCGNPAGNRSPIFSRPAAGGSWEVCWFEGSLVKGSPSQRWSSVRGLVATGCGGRIGGRARELRTLPAFPTFLAPLEKAEAAWSTRQSGAVQVGRRARWALSKSSKAGV